MSNQLISKVVFIVSLSFLLINNVKASGQVLYETDFEDNQLVTKTPNPVWSLRLDPDIGVIEGPGNFFTLVTGNAHSGTHSLRYNYQARNGFCNGCNGTARIHKTGLAYDNVTFFVDSSGADLTQSPIFAGVGRFIYNKSDGYSKWQITGIQTDTSLNDKLILTRVADGIDGATNTFNSGDVITVERVCGVDGLVADNIDRRRDCNEAISYLISPTFSDHPQKPGEAIYRRVYLKLDASSLVSEAPQLQKVRYWTDESTSSILLVLHRQVDSMKLGIESLAAFGGPAQDVIIDSVNVVPGVWYYIQEEFKARTAPDKNDGEYRLWFAEAGQESTTPVYELTGSSLSTVIAPSLWGNHQHWEDATGFWYIDDIKFSNVSIGPTAPDGSTIAPPKAPTPGQ
ncbi:MAG: hypothetical protein OEY06_03050 [Gammaproteobacteria bacterium]|nr:hypothetical protein [Gammaproteobacteria bacterium]